VTVCETFNRTQNVFIKKKTQLELVKICSNGDRQKTVAN